MSLANKYAAGNAANLVRERSGAGLPVDIVEVASRFADIERADWPFRSVDGLTVKCSSARPHIFFAGDPAALRTRFTIAHELGHAVMAWHIGTAECAMPQRGLYGQRSPLEQEADYFASELLLPTDWLKQTVVRHRADMSLVLRDVAEARASATASLIALTNALPQGWAFQMNNNPLSVTREFRSPLTRIEAQRISSASGVVELHEQTVRWWRLFDVPPLPELPPDKETAYAMLDRALGDYGHTAPDRKILVGRASGLLGSNAKGAVDVETGFGYLLYRLGSDPLYDTPDFRGWLAWVAASVLTR